MKISELQPIPRLRDGVTFPIVIAGQNLTATIEQIWESMPRAVVDFVGVVDSSGATIAQKSLYSDTSAVFDTATGTFLGMRLIDSSTLYTLFQGREHYIDSGGVRTDCLFRNSAGTLYYYKDGALLPVTASSSGGSGEGGTVDPMLVAQVQANSAAILGLEQRVDVIETNMPTTLSMRFVSEYGAQDTFITYGDTVQFQAVIEDGLRNDYTAEYDQWSIVRHNGDTPSDMAADGVWNATRAVISSSGLFSIEWSAEHDDLQAERATFIVTAQKGSDMASQVTGTLSI